MTRSAPPPFGKALPDVDVPRDVTIDRLSDALCNASRFFARERLGIQLPFEEAQPDDTEPMEMDTLDRYALSESLIAAEFRGTNFDALFSATSARGALPHGYAGSSFFGDTSHGAQNLFSLAKRYAAGANVVSEPVIIVLGEWRISGMLKVLNPPGVLQCRAAAVKARDYLRVWIAHVVLCSAGATPPDGGSYLIGTDGVFFLPSLATEKAREVLMSMMDVFVALHSRPVPLFPAAAMEFAKYALNRTGRMKKDPHSAADAAWNGGPFSKSKPESADAWNALVWRDVGNPLNADFEMTARMVFGPIVMNSEKLGGPDE
jgi:exodeoxyribonuclease V gamma subunit